MNISPWETRIAITWKGRLQNVYFSSSRDYALERTFFRGIITKVLPGIQTAFVDIGQERAGFLHISEVDRELALQRMSSTVELEDDQKESFKDHRILDIGKIFKEGDAVLVQVTKEPVYEKGAKLTTCFTLPGRFVVLLPNIPRIAISKKIEDFDERNRLKDIIRNNIPEVMGAIIRTTSDGRAERDIIRDLRFLIDTWHQIVKSYNSAKSKEVVYRDLPIILQIVRDHLDDDVESIMVDDKAAQSEIFKFVKRFAPEHSQRIKLYRGNQNIFNKYNINEYIEEALSDKVELPSGGSIIIETTQAMTVIDVNTGRYTGKTDLEETLSNTNLEAAEEIVHQLRLRNIGGLIVIDFIDMASQANRQKLFRYFEKTLKERDKFQSVVLKISEFGLVQMTRKRSGKMLLQELTDACVECDGTGRIKSIRTQTYEILNKVASTIKGSKKQGGQILKVNSHVFEYLSNIEYNAILHLERLCNCAITLVSDSKVPLNHYDLQLKIEK